MSNSSASTGREQWQKKSNGSGGSGSSSSSSNRLHNSLRLSEILLLLPQWLALNRQDTLDVLLAFLKVPGSPVSGVMELRSLLLAQKEEKILLRSLLDQMQVDLKGIRQAIVLKLISVSMPQQW